MTAILTPQQFPSSVLAVRGKNIMNGSTSTSTSTPTRTGNRNGNASAHPPSSNDPTPAPTPTPTPTMQPRPRRRIPKRISTSTSTSASQSSFLSVRNDNVHNVHNDDKEDDNDNTTNSNPNNKNHPNNNNHHNNHHNNPLYLVIAVLLWYSLGIVSISTTKLLLTPSSSSMSSTMSVSPSVLTIQQLFLGSTMLRLLLSIWTRTRTSSSNTNTNTNTYTNEKQEQENSDLEQGGGGGGNKTFATTRTASSVSVSTTVSTSSSIIIRSAHHQRRRLVRRRQSRGTSVLIQWLHQFLSNRLQLSSSSSSDNNKNNTESILLLYGAATMFSLGFLTTNYSFGQASASFVETIKAAEPLTSAVLATGIGLEVLSVKEWTSLGGIIVGVLCSTWGNSHSRIVASDDTSTTTSSLATSLTSCAMVMTSNICFSLRGLFQKLHAKQKQKHTNHQDGGGGGGATTTLSAVKLQWQFQTVGVYLLLIPTILLYGSWLVRNFSSLVKILLLGNSNNNSSNSHSQQAPLPDRMAMFQYIGLALINGMAFTSYNLASTFILSRITVVHHAALNCIRRIVAIVVTSIIFQTPITPLSGLGIGISILGFLFFSYFKQQEQQQQQQKQQLMLSMSKNDGDGNGYDYGNGSTSTSTGKVREQ